MHISNPLHNPSLKNQGFSISLGKISTGFHVVLTELKPAYAHLNNLGEFS